MQCSLVGCMVPCYNHHNKVFYAVSGGSGGSGDCDGRYIGDGSNGDGSGDAVCCIGLHGTMLQQPQPSVG